MSKFAEIRESLTERYAFAQHSFIRSIVRYPITNCLVQWCILILLSVIVISGGLFAFADLGLTDFTIIGEKDTRNFLAIDAVGDILDEEGVEAQETQFRAEQIFSVSFLFLFTVSEGQLFTPETVQEMCQVERTVLGQPLFTSYCQTSNPQGNLTDCDLQGEIFTVSRAFYPIEAERKACTLIPSQDIVNQRFAGLEDFRKEFIANDDVNPTVGRSLISLAGPLGADSPPFKDFDDVFEDFDDEQVVEGYEVLFQAFIDDLFEFYNIENKFLRSGFYTNFFQNSGSTLQTQTGGTFLDILGFDDFIVTDQALSAGSYAVVLLIMSIYIKSCLMSCLSMMAIAISMVVGLFLFAVVLQIDYFTPMNILVLFLIAGIGADNVFVLVDAWRQSDTAIIKMSRDSNENMFLRDMSEKQITRYLRLNYAYGRAALSVSHTAITTFIAFISTLSSPIGVIAGLGLFGAMVILTNLWYMFTVHPCNLMFWHHVTSKTPPVDEANASNGKDEKGEETHIEIEKKLTKLDKIFEKYIFFINETFFPHISFIAMMALSIGMIISTSKLETPASLESNYPLGHMFQDFLIDFNNLFTAGSEDSFTAVTAVYGIIDIDADGIKKLSGETFEGEPDFDENFEIFSKTSQDFILEVCNNLTALTCNEVGCVQPELVLPGSLICPLENFQNFLFDPERGFTESFVDPTVDGAIETNEQFLELLEEYLSITSSEIADLFGVFDNRLNFLMMTYRMTMIADQPLGIKAPVIELFDDFTEQVVDKAPEPLKTFFQNSFDHVWQHTERAFVSGLFSGLFISLTASFFVLLIGTKNPRVAFFAIVGVTSVVCSVLGTVRFIPNFALGTAESIAGVFVIGLAIDYIVHLGHMFMHSRTYLEGIKNPDLDSNDLYHRIFSQRGEVVYQNKDMVAFAIRKMGETVLAGAVTTFSSAAFLSLCTFVFFKKMSVLLMLTIFYSVSFAFLLFVPMLRLFGPGRRDDAEFVAQAEKVQQHEKEDK